MERRWNFSAGRPHKCRDNLKVLFHQSVAESTAPKIAQSTSLQAPSFVDYLSAQVNQVNDKIVADQRVADVATGKSQTFKE